MKAIWKRIESWLSENTPDILRSLKKGATAQEIQSTEKKLGMKLPKDVKQSFRIHNGQEGIGPPLIGEWQLLNLKAMNSQWKIMKDLFDKGQFEGAKAKSIGPVEAVWYKLEWIPVAHNGAGDLICVDLNPAPNGQKGQILTFWHMDEKREKIADSFTDWLEQFADALEAGRYRFQNDRLDLVKKKRS